MKVSRLRHDRILMAAGGLLVAAAIGGYSLFAQAPVTSDVPSQTGTAPPAAAENPNVPASGVVPGTAAPDAQVPVLPLGDDVAAPGAADSGVLPPSVNPAPAGGDPAFGAGLAPPSALPPFGAAPVGGGYGPSGAAPQAIPGKRSPAAKKSPGARPPLGGYGAPIGGYGTPLGSAMGAGGPPGMTGSPPPGMMPGMMPMSIPPEVALDQEIKSALKAYRTHANEPEVRAELVKVINNHIAEQFKIRQERREAEIKSIETELARVKQLHESRVANQEAIIASRLKELLSTADGLGWDLPDDSAVPTPATIQELR